MDCEKRRASFSHSLNKKKMKGRRKGINNNSTYEHTHTHTHTTNLNISISMDIAMHIIHGIVTTIFIYVFFCSVVFACLFYVMWIIFIQMSNKYCTNFSVLLLSTCYVQNGEETYSHSCTHQEHSFIFLYIHPLKHRLISNWKRKASKWTYFIHEREITIIACAIYITPNIRSTIVPFIFMCRYTLINYLSFLDFRWNQEFCFFLLNEVRIILVLWKIFSAFISRSQMLLRILLDCKRKLMFRRGGIANPRQHVHCGSHSRLWSFQLWL